MNLTFETEAPPLRVDQFGVCRVAGTRVTLESIVGGYLQGETPEHIHEGFPTVPLGDIYAIIAYYLKHRDQMDVYLRQTEDNEAEVRRRIDAGASPALREKIQAARRKLVSS
jgi:uncharacterized protein (DUF433 family)